MTVNVETGEITEPLTAMEASALTHAEAAIEQGVEQVGKALAEIRDQRLYRVGFSTFEAYCQERWGIARSTANRQIAAAEVIGILEPMGSTPNERQARELAPLREHPQVVRDVWKDVQRQTAGKPTATLIRDAVKRHLVPVPTPEPVNNDAVFWDDLAAKAKASGYLDKVAAEKPYVGAVIDLTYAADQIAKVSMSPQSLAANIPEVSRPRLPEIEAAAEWLNTFITAIKENA